MCIISIPYLENWEELYCFTKVSFRSLGETYNTTLQFNIIQWAASRQHGKKVWAAINFIKNTKNRFGPELIYSCKCKRNSALPLSVDISFGKNVDTMQRMCTSMHHSFERHLSPPTIHKILAMHCWS